MSETIKGFIIAFILFFLWSIGCFFGGYLLSNKRATEQLNKANRELAEQQQRYDNLIAETEERIRLADERIRNIRTELSKQISNNGKATEELSKLIEVIRKQKLDL